MDQNTETSPQRPTAIPTHSHHHHHHEHHHHHHHEYKKYSFGWIRHKIKKKISYKFFSRKAFLISLVIAAICAGGAIFIALSLHEADLINAPQKVAKWPDILKVYKDDPNTNQLLFIKCDDSSIAEACYYMKSEDGSTWDLVAHGKAYIGIKGLGKRHEGDKKTPEGDFNVTGAFGIKENPGTVFPYININHYTIACDEDCEYYNQIIDVRKTGIHKGEVMMDCTPAYFYGMTIDFNPTNTPGLGSNIFVHCTGYSRYTAGCVALEESMLLEILTTATPGIKVCIHEK